MYRCSLDQTLHHACMKLHTGLVQTMVQQWHIYTTLFLNLNHLKYMYTMIVGYEKCYILRLYYSVQKKCWSWCTSHNKQQQFTVYKVINQNSLIRSCRFLTRGAFPLLICKRLFRVKAHTSFMEPHCAIITTDHWHSSVIGYATDTKQLFM